MSIYIPTLVKELRELYAPILNKPGREQKVNEQLASFAELNFEAFKSERPLAAALIANHHPDHLGKTDERLLELPLAIEDFYLMVAREYGYPSWQDVPANKIDPVFEQALLFFLGGQVEALEDILRQFPEVVNQQSSYGHEAYLLHYAGSNGVEMRNQLVPMNLVEMTRVLLDAGAQKDSLMKVYGGQHTTWALYSSSAHPYEAGIDEGQMKDLLE